MAEGDPTDRGGIEHLGHGVAHRREQRLHPGLEQQRLFVANQKLTELEIGLWHVRGDAKDVRCNFADGGHRFLRGRIVYMRNTPCLASGTGALLAISIPKASASRVSSGSRMPSSQMRAVE